MNPANVIVTALALLAVLLARHGLRSLAERSVVARRLRNLYAIIAAILACRLLATLVESGTVLTAATMTVAAWLPFAALRLVEELTRRHAARLAKLLALGGAIGFTIVAVTVGLFWRKGVILALAAFQALLLLMMVVQLARERPALGAADRGTASALLLALLLAVPLVLTDFKALFPDLDVRGGPFAVLLLVLASSTAQVERHALRRFVVDAALMLFAGGVALVAAEAAGPAPTLSLAGPVAALAGLLLLVERFARAPAGPAGLVAALARTASPSREALLASHPMLANGRLLGPADLAAYPAGSITALLRDLVTTADDADEEVRALARELLVSHDATHLVRLRADPPSLLAVSAGELASPALTDELVLAARLLERLP